MSCECPTSELPGEAAAGKGLAAVVGLHPALCQPRTGQRNRGPNFPNSSTSVPPRITIVLLDRHLPHSASEQCKHPAALRSSAAGSFQAVTPLPPQAPSEESRPSTPRYGFAVVIPGRYSSTPPPGKSPPEVFRASRWQPFRLLAQTVSEQVRHRLRRRPRISDVSVVLLFEGQCQFANTVVPHINAGAALTGWAVPAQAPEGVCPPAAPVFVWVWEPKVSQTLRRQSPPHPHTAKHPPWPRSTRFARSAPYGTGRLTAAAQGHRRNLRVYETASTIGHPGTHAQTSSRPRPASPARRTAKGFIYTPKEAAADVAAGCFQGDCNAAKSL